MAKTDNLTDFLTDLANGIRLAETGSEAGENINPQDFRARIEGLGTATTETIPDFTEAEDFKLDVSGLDTELEISYSVSEKVALPAGRNILAYIEDENFTPSNIKKGVSVFGLEGIYESELVAQWDGTGVIVAPTEPAEPEVPEEPEEPEIPEEPEVPEEPVAPNTFKINGTSYQMENRMTWYAWTRSEYNTDGFSCASEIDYVYEAESSNKVTDADGNDVLGTTYIVEGGAYLIKKVVSLITFTIDGEEYQAEDGMNWYQWAQSDYAPDSYSCSGEDSQVNPSGDTYIVDRDNEEVLGRELIISGNSYSIKEFST